MHDHEFEEQVHQKMEELSLRPSDAVWTNVEGQLHEKKRRRRILWLPFIFVFGILGGYFSIHHFHPKAQPTLTRNNKETAHVADRKSAISVSANEKTAIKVKDITTARTLGTKQKNLDKLEPKKSKINQPLPSPAAVSYASGIALSDKKLLKHPMSSGDKPQRAEKTNAVAIRHFNKTHHHEKGDKTITAGLSESGKKIAAADAVMSIIDTILNQENLGLSKNLSAAVIDSVVLRKGPFYTHIFMADYKNSANLTIKLSKKNKLSWGFTLQAGKTSLTDGKLNKLFTPSTADAFSQSSPNTNIGGIVTPPVFSSGIQSHTGFSAGFFLRRKLDSRFALSTGINYTLFTTSITIGSNSKYINKYHFIELPLLLQTQLNSSVKTPLIWEAGISLSQLISSNALHLDSAVNRLYKDNHLFYHTQVSFLTGLYLQVFSSSKHPFRIGPQLQYGITRLLSGNTDKRDYLFEYGLKISTVIK